jgi:hypothetical protein
MNRTGRDCWMVCQSPLMYRLIQWTDCNVGSCRVVGTLRVPWLPRSSVVFAMAVIREGTRSANGTRSVPATLAAYRSAGALDNPTIGLELQARWRSWRTWTNAGNSRRFSKSATGGLGPQTGGVGGLGNHSFFCAAQNPYPPISPVARKFSRMRSMKGRLTDL